MFVVLVSGGTHALNSLVFSEWGRFADWAYLGGTIGLVTVAVHLVLRAMMPAAQTAPPAETDPDVFARRLPIEVRGPLVRIEAQDHYLYMVIARGNTMVLMRLGDAISELSGQGVQVHRSHWVAPDAMAHYRRDKGRDMMVMVDGAQVAGEPEFQKGGAGSRAALTRRFAMSGQAPSYLAGSQSGFAPRSLPHALRR
jgi:hypothetical protein